MSETSLAWLNIVGILLALLTVSALLTWIERRLLGLWQDRYGPNRVGPFGILQLVADGIKLLTAVLLAELLYVIGFGVRAGTALEVVAAKQVGVALFGPYLLAVELASMLLLAGVMGAWQLGRQTASDEPEEGTERDGDAG